MWLPMCIHKNFDSHFPVVPSCPVQRSIPTVVGRVRITCSKFNATHNYILVSAKALSVSFAQSRARSRAQSQIFTTNEQRMNTIVKDILCQIYSLLFSKVWRKVGIKDRSHGCRCWWCSGFARVIVVYVSVRTYRMLSKGKKLPVNFLQCYIYSYIHTRLRY